GTCLPLIVSMPILPSSKHHFVGDCSVCSVERGNELVHSELSLLMSFDIEEDGASVEHYHAAPIANGASHIVGDHDGGTAIFTHNPFSHLLEQDLVLWIERRNM